MPLSSIVQEALKNDLNPRIDVSNQGGSHLVIDEDIPEILTFLNENKNLKSLTIIGQQITDPDNLLRNFITKHPTISSVSFYANNKLQQKHDGQTYANPIPGLGKDDEQSLNQLLKDKKRLNSIKIYITNDFLSKNPASMTIDLLSTVYQNLQIMREIQAKHPILEDCTTAITIPCLQKIFTSMKILIIDLFSAEDSLKKIKNKFPEEQKNHVEKINGDKTFSALEASIKGFINNHKNDTLIGTPKIVKQLQFYCDFLDSITAEDKKLDLTNTSTNSTRFDFNIPSDSLPSCDNTVQPQ